MVLLAEERSHESGSQPPHTGVVTPLQGVATSLILTIWDCKGVTNLLQQVLNLFRVVRRLRPIIRESRPPYQRVATPLEYLAAREKRRVVLLAEPLQERPHESGTRLRYKKVVTPLQRAAISLIEPVWDCQGVTTLTQPIFKHLRIVRRSRPITRESRPPY